MRRDCRPHAIYRWHPGALGSGAPESAAAACFGRAPERQNKGLVAPVREKGTRIYFAAPAQVERPGEIVRRGRDQCEAEPRSRAV